MLFLLPASIQAFMASKANRLKSEDSEEKEKEKTKKSKSSKGRLKAFRNFLADERTHKIGGLVLLLLSFFMLVAFVSNLFTWEQDQAVAGADSAWQLLL